MPRSPATYIVQINSQPYPTPLQGQLPAGSLIYDPSVTGGINFAGDTDTYTLPLAAGQTLSLLLMTDPTLIGTITVLDPSGNTLGSATAASAGANVVLQTDSNHDRGDLLAGRQRLGRHRQLHDAGHLERGLQAGHRHQ